MHNKLLFYFVIYSFLGWCIESIYKTILEKKPINSGFLHGPYCPIYGFGAIIMIIILQKISDNIFLTFLIATIILTIWEYIVGVILEKVFKTKYWDYSHLKFNINGRICLKNSIYWGILGIIFSNVVHPLVIKCVGYIPNNILLYINIILHIILLTDAIITITKILFIDKKLKQLSEISELLKEKMQELKQIDKLEKVYKENVQNLISDLKKKQANIKRKLYRLMIRLKNAFPTMQSETINNFITQRIEELQTIKKRIKEDKEK